MGGVWEVGISGMGGDVKERDWDVEEKREAG